MRSYIRGVLNDVHSYDDVHLKFILAFFPYCDTLFHSRAGRDAADPVRPRDVLGRARRGGGEALDEDPARRARLPARRGARRVCRKGALWNGALI